jgi:hypothetical protein
MVFPGQDVQRTLGNNFLKGNVKFGFVFDILLYSDAKQLFHNISIIKIKHNVYIIRATWKYLMYKFLLLESCSFPSNLLLVLNKLTESTHTHDAKIARQETKILKTDVQLCAAISKGCITKTLEPETIGQ